MEGFQSCTKTIVPSLGKVKQLEDQCGGLLIKLEWCGMQCSGKYGAFSKLKNYSTDRLGITDHSSESTDQSKLLLLLSITCM